VNHSFPAQLKAHVGKSLYAEQLAHWFARIPEELFWLEALEDFAAEPRRAFERVLEWLGPGQQKRAKFPTSKAHISAVFDSFRLIFGRAIVSRNGLEAWMLFLERARAEHSR